MLIKLFTTLYYTVYKVQSKPLYTKIFEIVSFFSKPFFFAILPFIQASSDKVSAFFLQFCRGTHKVYAERATHLRKERVFQRCS